MKKRTLYDKIWDSHVIYNNSDGTSLVYIDRHYIHEVTSPQAFEGIRVAKRKLWRADSNIAVPDHNIPTINRKEGIKDAISKIQVDMLDRNCEYFEIPEFKMTDPNQGIVHVVGPEQGLTLPGMIVVCGDSHTSTHGALGALGFGIGTSEVEHVLSTQCLIQKKAKNMFISVEGKLNKGVGAKDVILYIIGKIGTDGASGYSIEFGGSTIKSLSIESRMTICNMAIEAGARSGLVGVDSKTLDYLKNKPYSPKGELWHMAEKFWKSLVSDPEAEYDKIIKFKATEIKPMVTWGTSPEMVLPINEIIPKISTDNFTDALKYMDLDQGDRVKDFKIDKVFIGSCTNSRIEDLREAAKVIKGKKIAKSIKLALVVPGSGPVKLQAEKEGLDLIFKNAGFEWREPGCSMCLAMNADQLEPGESCASTSNRNFEGRQGKGGRTHLVSPSMAAAAAINGRFVDITRY